MTEQTTTKRMRSQKRATRRVLKLVREYIALHDEAERLNHRIDFHDAENDGPAPLGWYDEAIAATQRRQEFWARHPSVGACMTVWGMEQSRELSA